MLIMSFKLFTLLDNPAVKGMTHSGFHPNHNRLIHFITYHMANPSFSVSSLRQTYFLLSAG
jgi:hypothetical protein